VRVEQGKRPPTKVLAFRRRIGHFIESRPVERVMLSLLALDVFCVFIETLIDVEVIPHSHAAVETEHVFHIASLTILSLFLLEHLTLIFAFGRSYFTHVGYIVDLVVITASLALELLLTTDALGLIIIVRLWRVVRIVHGVFEEVKHKLHKAHLALEHECAHAEMLERDLKRALIYSRTLTQHLKLAGIQFPAVPRYEYVEKMTIRELERRGIRTAEATQFARAKSQRAGIQLDLVTDRITEREAARRPKRERAEAKARAKAEAKAQAEAEARGSKAPPASVPPAGAAGAGTATSSTNGRTGGGAAPDADAGATPSPIDRVTVGEGGAVAGARRSAAATLTPTAADNHTAA
jgi:hypothetical protein